AVSSGRRTPRRTRRSSPSPPADRLRAHVRAVSESLPGYRGGEERRMDLPAHACRPGDRVQSSTQRLGPLRDDRLRGRRAGRQDPPRRPQRRRPRRFPRAERQRQRGDVDRSRRRPGPHGL
ncbi:MAG: hypothetical protein AVDCRST_MAG12-2714, partial [uncultured Rubrobacteraceae bacterium]